MNEQTASDLRIIKTASCLSVSGRTTIGYHIGLRDERDVCFRVWKTSGKGVFSKEWVCASDIHKVLGQHDSLTAPMLLPLFTVGRSVNSAGFLLAVLKNEGLVTLSAEQPHAYVKANPSAFIQVVTTLMKSGVSLNAEADSPAIKKTRRGRTVAWQAAEGSDDPTQGA
jgi:hypothetical protein